MNAIRRVTDHYNWQLLLASGLLTLSSMNYGFDDRGFSSTQAIDAFIKQFGEYNAKTKKYAIPPYFLSLMNSLIFIGQATGLWLGSYVSARYGRRVCVLCMSCWALVSASVIISSKERGQMITGRILNYIYVGMEMSVIGNYQAELVPRAVRGFAVGSYQFSIGFGGIVMGIICKYTSTMHSNLAWRIPMALYYVIPTIIISTVWLMPESPRWLASKGRIEDAKMVLKRVRKNATIESIQGELEEIVYGLEAEKGSGSYADLFKGANLRRTAIVAIASVFIQLTGQSFVSSYGAVFYKQVGVSNPFAITASTSGLMTFAVFLNMYLGDWFGRRTMLLAAGTLQGACIFVVGGMGLRKDAIAARPIIVAFNMLFGFSFGLGWGPAHWTITAEVPQQKLRDKTTRLGGSIVIVCNFLVSFTIPYLLYAPYANLHSKVGFIFGPICIVSVLWVFFFLPELKGRSLEEVDQLFEEGIGALKSVHWKPIADPATLSHAAEDLDEVKETVIESERSRV